jgi:hypothetical protein
VHNFVFGAVTSVLPVLAVPYLLPDEVRQQGIDERTRAAGAPGLVPIDQHVADYGDGVQLLDVPAYAKAGGEIEITDIED